MENKYNISGYLYRIVVYELLYLMKLLLIVRADLHQLSHEPLSQYKSKFDTIGLIIKQYIIDNTHVTNQQIVSMLHQS